MLSTGYAISDGLRIRYAYTQQGGDPPMLFIHGLGGRLEAWGPVMQELADLGLRMVALDLRGFGLSQRPPTIPGLTEFARDVKAVMDDLGLEEAVLIGSSMGGMVALRFHGLHPHRTRALVLSNTAPRVRINRELLTRALEGDPEATRMLLSRLSHRMGTSDRTPGTMGGVLTGSRDYILGVAERLEEEDLEAEAAWTRAPTLVIVGEEDPITPPREARRLALLIEGAQLEVISQARHLTHIDAPREYAARVREFLEKRVLTTR